MTAGGIEVAYTFVATDESWTPIALVEGTSTQSGKVLSQSSSDPFGQLLNRDDLTTDALFRRCDVGHQGLFFEPYEDEMAAYDGTQDRLKPGKPGLYFNRARWCDAAKGRFTTSDPNATGMAVVGNVGWHGVRPGGMRPGLDVNALYGDGLSLYARGGANPFRFDASGQFLSVSALSSIAIRSVTMGISFAMFTIWENPNHVTNREVAGSFAVGCAVGPFLPPIGGAVAAGRFEAPAARGVTAGLREGLSDEMSAAMSENLALAGGVSDRMLADDMVVAEGLLEDATAGIAVEIAPGKIQYLLNDPGKGYLFRQTLGFSENSASGLASQIQKGFGTAQTSKLSSYGIKFESDVVVTGPSGRSVDMTFVYMIKKQGTGIPEFITAVPR